MATDDEIEAGCRGAYGKHWDGPADRMPGPQMKGVWRKHVRQIVEAVDKCHAENAHACMES